MKLLGGYKLLRCGVIQPCRHTIICLFYLCCGGLLHCFPPVAIVLGRIRPTFRPTSTVIDRTWPGVDRILFGFDRLSPNFDHVSGATRPASAHWLDSVQTWAEIARHCVEVHRIGGNFARTRSNWLGVRQIWASFGTRPFLTSSVEFGSHVAKSSPSLGWFCLHSATVPMSTKFGSSSSRFGHMFARLGPRSTGIAHIWPTRGRTLPKPGFRV